MKEILSRSVGQPKKRLSHVYDLCRLRRVCEGGDTVDKKFAGDDQEEEETVSLPICVIATVGLNKFMLQKGLQQDLDGTRESFADILNKICSHMWKIWRRARVPLSFSSRVMLSVLFVIS